MKKLLYCSSLLAMFLACTQTSEITQEVPFEFEVLDYFTEDVIADSVFESYIDNNHYDEVASLGRYLFYDNRLSKNNTISCGSCHEQSKSFADGEQFSTGLQNGMTPRNSMSLINEMFHISYFWDGQRPNSNGDIPVLNPVSNHVEMGMSGPEELVDKLSEIDTYVNLFQEIYNEEISEHNISKALEMFIESIISEESKYDDGLISDFINFDTQELAGMELFNGKALCSECHTGDQFVATWRSVANIGLEIDYADEGAGVGHFKVPTLRNIELTGPYMHDGRFATLEEVVDHYVNGVKAHPQLDWTLKNHDISLSEDEQESLIAFLHTLTDYSVLTDERFSNPY